MASDRAPHDKPTPEAAIAGGAGPALVGAGRHDGRGQIVHRPAAGAAARNLPFVDADTEIEKCRRHVAFRDIFATHGEPDFRAGEARVIARLLDGGPQVLATGGGAFMIPHTRVSDRAKGISVWLKAEFDVLMRASSAATTGRC